jgi:hypothetical protein
MFKFDESMQGENYFLEFIGRFTRPAL